jgi:hypothetical protein
MEWRKCDEDRQEPKPNKYKRIYLAQGADMLQNLLPSFVPSYPKPTTLLALPPSAVTTENPRRK